MTRREPGPYRLVAAGERTRRAFTLKAPADARGADERSCTGALIGNTCKR